jgi:hypothetical protein
MDFTTLQQTLAGKNEIEMKDLREVIRFEGFS